MAAPAVLLPPIDRDALWSLMVRAEELGLRLEMTDTGLVWEAMPGLRHRELALAIYGAIQPASEGGGCECYRTFDVPIRFASGIVKRPDVAVFCRRPAQEEGFVEAVPEAVVEITSPEYEEKDLVSGPPLYLANGVKDVVVLHRSRGETRHWTASGVRRMPSPATILLRCGCQVTV